MKFKKHRRRADINIVPLIDVLIVLIFFFLMTMQFRDMNVLNITPPKVESASEVGGEVAEMLRVSVDKDGVFYVNGEEVSEDGLTAQLQGAARLEIKPIILVQADEDVPLKYVTRIMDETRKAELDKVRRQTR